MRFNMNHISPSISPEKAENPAQNEQLKAIRGYRRLFIMYAKEKTDASDKIKYLILAFLNNLVGVLYTEADIRSGIATNTIWELK